MTSTYVPRSDLEASLLRGDGEPLVEKLEQLVSCGKASLNEQLLLGILLLFPPYVDPEGAVSVLRNLLDGERGFDAAIWIALTWKSQMPVGDRAFVGILEAHERSPVAHHLLSAVAWSDGNTELALHHNRISRKIELFPFNIMRALKIDPSINAEEQAYLHKVFQDLVVTRHAELDEPVSTVEGMISRYKDNQIFGCRLTSMFWEYAFPDS